ncbi:MAG: tetratricopeptide repeat protein [Proteobacteria bacterium]|nr:tetratricopeptide repeat protein [Pseudomonadota bacterium]
MKKLITIIIVIGLTLVAAFVTPWLMKDPGVVSVQLMGYEIQMTVVVALGLFIAFIVLFWLVVYFLRLPKNVMKNMSINRSRKSFAKGLLALSEGKWKAAEKQLLISTKNSLTPELGFMAAARAAVAQNKLDDAFNYLDDAENSTENPLTVDLTRCELWAKIGNYDKAINLLNRILKSYPNNPRALYLMTQASQNSGQWQRLREILPKVEKLAILPQEKVTLLIQQSIQQQLEFAESETQLLDTWNSLNKQQKSEYNYILAYSQTGLKLGLYEPVAKLTETALNKDFSEPLLTIWGQLNINDKQKNDKQKTNTAEKWLRKHPENAQLLSILGQMCLKNKLWGKAQSYLQKSLEINPNAETFKLMAQYVDAVGEPDNALAAYRQAEGTSSQLVLIDDSSKKEIS